MPNHCLCDQLCIRISVLVHSRAARSTSKRTSFKSKQHVNLVLCVRLFYKSQHQCFWGDLLALGNPCSPKGQNASRDGLVNLKISLNSIASFGSLSPLALALFLAYETLSIDRNHLELAIESSYNISNGVQPSGVVVLIANRTSTS